MSVRVDSRFFSATKPNSPVCARNSLAVWRISRQNLLKTGSYKSITLRILVAIIFYTRQELRIEPITLVTNRFTTDRLRNEFRIILPRFENVYYFRKYLHYDYGIVIRASTRTYLRRINACIARIRNTALALVHIRDQTFEPRT